MFPTSCCKGIIFGAMLRIQRPALKRDSFCLLPLISLRTLHYASHTAQPFALLRLKKPNVLSVRHISFLFKFKPGPMLTRREKSINNVCYCTGTVVVMFGVCFAALPLYKMFCESTGFQGTTQVAQSLERIESMDKVDDRLIRVQFNAEVPSSMTWKFKPAQTEIFVHPGETALAFFTAFNPSDKPIVGISTYNVTPFQAAYYFTKIQCFCFDEQILNPGEEVDLPVFFYIDPDFVTDPDLEHFNDLLLSYTFFESKSGLVLPSPFDPKNRPFNQQMLMKQAG